MRASAPSLSCPPCLPDPFPPGPTYLWNLPLPSSKNPPWAKISCGEPREEGRRESKGLEGGSEWTPVV